MYNQTTFSEEPLFHKFKYSPLREQSSRLNLTDEEQNHIKNSFREYDSNKKGYLTRFEYKLAFIAVMGFHPSRIEVDSLFPKYKHTPIVEVPVPDEGGVSLSQFIQLMSEKLKRIDEMDRIRSIFLCFDRNSNGYLTVGDLKHVFEQVMPKSKNHMEQKMIISQIFQAFDKNKDGMITYGDFCEMMKYGKGSKTP